MMTNKNRTEQIKNRIERNQTEEPKRKYREQNRTEQPLDHRGGLLTYTYL
jgi:hypothetical protein